MFQALSWEAFQGALLGYSTLHRADFILNLMLKLWAQEATPLTTSDGLFNCAIFKPSFPLIQLFALAACLLLISMFTVYSLCDKVYTYYKYCLIKWGLE